MVFIICFCCPIVVLNIYIRRIICGYLCHIICGYLCHVTQLVMLIEKKQSSEAAVEALKCSVLKPCWVNIGDQFLQLTRQAAADIIHEGNI